MKRINKFLQMVKGQLSAAATPEKKREYLEDAKSLAPDILNGIWLEVAMIGINALESTIKE